MKSKQDGRNRKHFSAAGLRPGVNVGFIALVTIMAMTGYLMYSGAVASGIISFVFVLSGWLIALCLHEFGHALTAYHGGDREIADTGYLTLDPLSYTHPVNSLLMPALFIILGFIALPGGAVYVRSSALRSRHWDCAVSAAGPLATLLCFCAMCAPFTLGWHQEGGTLVFWSSLAVLAGFTALSLVWNLLPVPGLDGWGVIEPYMSPEIQAASNHWRQMGPMFLVMAVILFRPLGSFVMKLMLGMLTAFDVPLSLFGAGWQHFSFWY